MLVFVSYSRRDREFALRLVERLRAWGHDTWIDIQNIPKGVPWPDEIDKGLEAADVVVGVLSENSMASGNVKNEWDWALEYDTPLIPVRLEKCKVSHRFVRLNYIDCAGDEAAGFDQLHTALRAPKTIFREASPGEKAAPAPVVREPRGVDNRARMLQKVHDFWIAGVLEPSRIGDVWLDLPAGQRPTAVQPEIKRDLRSADFDTFTLGTDKPIADVFRRLGRELLILGAPGSGKTMTLLELAKDLIAQAQADESLPVPVVLNLASWAEQHPDRLEDWLAERLFLEYGVPRKLTARWIADGALLFLLDGLDEVKADCRDACVTAINAFWERYDQVDNGIVVCSRIADYDLLHERLRLENAIELQALAPGQADAYLAQLGAAWDDLRAALPGDPVLRAMSESPLLLNIMAVAYRDTPREQIAGLSEDDQRRKVFKHYVDRRLHESAPHKKYSHAQTRHYLSWLARKMKEHDQTVFQIEGLQPDWLDTEQHKQYRRRIDFIGLIVGSVVGLGIVLVLGLIVGLVDGLVAGTVLGLAIGGFVGVIGPDSGGQINIVDKLKWSWTRAQIGAIIGLILGLVVGCFSQLVLGQDYGLRDGLIFGLASGPTAGLIGNRIELRTTSNDGIRHSLANGLLIMLIVGLLVALFVGLVVKPGMGLFVGLMIGLFVGLRYGGNAVIQHVLIRRLLYRAGDAPLNYAEFLDYCAERHLLRKVGGGYVFRHRMLLDYFAASEN